MGGKCPPMSLLATPLPVTQATIIKQIGSLTYRVDLNNQTRTAHVNHIKPAPMGDHLVLILPF